MSAETIEWLNANTLIGYTDEYGKAWHHDGAADNQFVGPVPTDRAKELLGFHVEAVRPKIVTGKAMEGTVKITIDEDHWAIIHPTTQQVFQYTSNIYAVHQYDEWLMDQVGTLIDASAGDLTIGSVGLLKGGGIAWVQVRPPEGVTVGGEKQLPWILATTSHNGSLSTSFRSVRQRAVCDNTLAGAPAEKTTVYKVKHTVGSEMKIGEAREALDVMWTAQDEFTKEVEKLANTPFDNDQFRGLNETLYPVVQPKLEWDAEKKEMVQTNVRAVNNREREIAALEALWFDDPRVTPVKNSAYGAWMAHNTHRQWKNGATNERRVRQMVGGEGERDDRRVLTAISEIRGDGF